MRIDRRLGAALVLPVVLLSACGDDDEGGATTTLPPAEDAAPVTSVPRGVDATADPVPDDEGPVGWQQVDVTLGLRFAVPDDFTPAPSRAVNPRGITYSDSETPYVHEVTVDQAAAPTEGEAAQPLDLDGYRRHLEAGGEVQWEPGSVDGMPGARFVLTSPEGDSVIDGIAVQTTAGTVVLRRQRVLDVDDPLVEIPLDAYVEHLALDPGTIPGDFWLTP